MVNADEVAAPQPVGQPYTYNAQATQAPVPPAQNLAQGMKVDQTQPQVVYVQQPVQQQAIDPRLAARGVAPGGTYQDEKYCGPISLLIGFLAFPCICCCPCDERTAYTEPGTGRKVYLKN
eukprot:CAMPEP_0203749182 /NCGR_PEP_ID=MMETSP0098-20131031/3838_1 /ASSEMBLY_ACC=CAM_ASM_000208 /TAXON_ID=96639 /ORGANISM=" , Strain NY0313808BC1" /LENGTH=119 /DNA_ID=CAMNT_0050638167 /DNA_START=674 /DNA_END=1033 /DNA_ORIENTATION=-